MVEKCVEIGLQTCEIILKAIGEYVDIVFWSDDLGMATGPLISPKMYRSLIKPYQKEIVDRVRSLAEVKIVIHSDGCIYPFIRDFIDIGIDAINPVQHNLGRVKNMDPLALKNEFGAEISFWGGIDTSHVLSFGSPSEVKDEVKRRIEELGPGGGFILASVHNIQPEVPPENVIAMLESAREYGEY